MYNQCVSFFNSGEPLPKKVSLDQYIQSLQKQAENKWTTCLGKTRQEAVCEAEQAYRQARKANPGKPVKIKYRSCRDNSQVIQFKNDAFKSGTWFPSKVRGLLFGTAYGYEFPTQCVYGTELAYQRTKHGYHWFAVFPQAEPVVKKDTDKVIGFDPGIRTFLTGFDGENLLEVGKKDLGRIVRLCLHLDRLIGRKSRAKGQSQKKLRYRLGLAIKRLRVRIKNLVNDLHHKVSRLIIAHYKIVFLPTYKASEMVLKVSRKINRKSVRSMLTWSMSRFANHLEQMALRHGVLVIRTNEAYTSKTCPKCGKIHQKLGGNKTFTCPECGFTLPRDWVGAINNLIKAIASLDFEVQDNQLMINCAG